MLFRSGRVAALSKVLAKEHKRLGGLLERWLEAHYAGAVLSPDEAGSVLQRLRAQDHEAALRALDGKLPVRELLAKLKFREELLGDEWLASFEEAWDGGTLQGTELLSGAGLAIDFELPFSEAQSSFEAKAFTSALNYSDRALAEARQTILSGLSEGKTAKAIARDLQGVLTKHSQAQLETTVRTNINDAYNMGRREVGRRAGVYGLMFVNPLDEDTTPICQELSGMVLPMGDERIGQWEPPFHYNCRTYQTYVLEPGEVEDPFPPDDAALVALLPEGFK